MNEIEIFKNARNERAFMNFINSTEFNALVDSDLEICLEYYKNICNYIKYVTSTINKNNATKLSEKWVLRNLIDDMLLDKSLEENQFAFVYFIRNTENIALPNYVMNSYREIKGSMKNFYTEENKRY